MQLLKNMPTGLLTALKMTFINSNLLIILYFFFGFDNLPNEMPFIMFLVMTFIMGGLVPAYLGGYVFNLFSRKYAGKEMVLFSVLAIALALLETIPNGKNNATTDMFLITAVLHFSTAISGIWLIPKGVTRTNLDEQGQPLEQ
jgi:hypothetical protein